MSSYCTIFIVPSQSNHTGIETCLMSFATLFYELPIEPYWNWNLTALYGILSLTVPPNRTILELKPSRPKGLRSRVFLPIEPYWNWNWSDQTSQRGRIDSQSNHTGIETNMLYQYYHLLIYSQSNHTGIETKVLSVQVLFKTPPNRTILELKLGRGSNGRFAVNGSQSNHTGIETS